MNFWERRGNVFTDFFLFIRMKTEKKFAPSFRTEYFIESGKRRFLVRLKLILVRNAYWLYVPALWMKMGRIVPLQE